MRILHSISTAYNPMFHSKHMYIMQQQQKILPVNSMLFSQGIWSTTHPSSTIYLKASNDTSAAHNKQEPSYWHKEKQTGFSKASSEWARLHQYRPRLRPSTNITRPYINPTCIFVWYYLQSPLISDLCYPPRVFSELCRIFKMSKCTVRYIWNI